MNTPSINPLLSTPTSIQHTDTSIGALCKKIIKLVATIFLTIITLGLYLIWKYCCPSVFPCISKKQPTPISRTNDPIFIFDASGKLVKLPQHIVMDSLEFMNEMAKHGLNPCSSQRFSLFGTLNPAFVASYPLTIKNVYASALTRLQELALSPNEEQRAVAEACLSQINYLDQGYYIVNVPGDHSCFFRSYAIGWLCALDKQKQTNEQIFEQEIQKLLLNPFAYSSQKNALLTQQAIAVLQKCQQCTSVNQLYNEIILSPETIQPLLVYLRQLSFYTADQQKKEILGENNLRSLLSAQIRENRLLFERAATHFLGRSYESHLSMESMLTQTQTFDSALQECLFLFEFLPLCLLSQHQLSALPPEKRSQKKMQIIVASFFTFIDFEVRQQCSDQMLQQLLQTSPIMQQQFHEFVAFWNQNFPQLSFCQSTLFYLFLRTHPYHLNQQNAAFVQKMTQILQSVLGLEPSLCEFLKSAPDITQAYNDMLSSCKAYAVAIDLLEAFLQTPLTILNYPMSSLTDPADLATLRQMYDKLVQCLISIPLTQANRDLLAQTTHLFYESAPTPLVSKILEFKKNLSTLCPIDELGTPEVAQSVVLFLFFLQHHTFLEQVPDKDLVLNICSLFMPHLQKSMRTHGALHVTLLAQACGDLCAIELPSTEQPPKSLFKNILSLMFKNPHAASVLQSLFHLPSLFGHRLPSGQDVAELSNELSLALPEAWENHVRGAQVLSRLLPLNSKHPTLGPTFLLISFLLQNQERLEVLPSSLRDRVQQILDHMQFLIDEHVELLPPLQQEMLVLRYASLYQIHHRVRQHVIVGSPTEGLHSESFLNYLVHRNIEQMPLEELLLFSHNIFYQAEDEHVAAISSALGNLSVCQSLLDSQFTNSPAQVLSLSSTHGFISLDFLPESQGSVFVLKENNHYSALLPKDIRLDAPVEEPRPIDESSGNNEQAHEPPADEHQST